MKAPQYGKLLDTFIVVSRKPLAFIKISTLALISIYTAVASYNAYYN